MGRDSGSELSGSVYFRQAREQPTLEDLSDDCPRGKALLPILFRKLPVIDGCFLAEPPPPDASAVMVEDRQAVKCHCQCFDLFLDGLGTL